MFWPEDSTKDPYHEAKLRALASRRRAGRVYTAEEQEAEADAEERYALQDDEAEMAAVAARFFGDR